MRENLFEQIKRFTPSGKNSNKAFKVRGKRDLTIFEGEDLLTEKRAEFVVSDRQKTWSTVLLFILTVGFLLFYASRAFTLQIIQNDKGKELSDQNRIRNLLLTPERGVIYDRSGEYIVRNKPAFSINLTTGICMSGGSSYCKNLVKNVSAFVPVDTARVESELEANKPEIIIAAGLDKEQILSLEANISKFPGLSIVTNPKRDYLHKDVFAHLVGYVGIGGDTVPAIEGKMGVERSYDSYINGTFGSRLIQADAMGNYLQTISEKPAVPGHNVTLYADLKLQKKAYELIKAIVDEKKADGAAVVAQDPQTGGVLAMASYPSFDPDKLSGGITASELAQLNADPGFPFFNRAISAVYPPGSTFKMVVASAVLSEKVVTEHTIVNDPGYIAVGSYVFRNWKLDGHGEVNLKRALQVSNDTYFYTVGGGHGGIEGLGIERLAKWAKRFGYGSKTGIDIEGEVEGYMPDGTARDWYLGDTYITSIGQGDVLATPLQVNNYICYFANGGKLMKPQVVKSVEGVFEYEPKALTQNITDEHTLNLVREGMKMVVEPGGTAYPLFDFPDKHPGIELAGKTGTSEYTDTKGEERTHAWFSVFGPYENANIAITVFLEGGGGGSDEAAPIARALLDLWFEEFAAE